MTKRDRNKEIMSNKKRNESAGKENGDQKNCRQLRLCPSDDRRTTDTHKRSIKVHWECSARTLTTCLHSDSRSG